MLTIEDAPFARAVEAVEIACRSAKDANGLRVYADLPRDPHRIMAIVLGAVVAMTNSAVCLESEHPISLSDLAVAKETA